MFKEFYIEIEKELSEKLKEFQDKLKVEYQIQERQLVKYHSIEPLINQELIRAQKYIDCWIEIKFLYYQIKIHQNSEKIAEEISDVTQQFRNWLFNWTRYLFELHRKSYLRANSIIPEHFANFPMINNAINAEFSRFKNPCFLKFIENALNKIEIIYNITSAIQERIDFVAYQRYLRSRICNELENNSDIQEIIKMLREYHDKNSEEFSQWILCVSAKSSNDKNLQNQLIAIFPDIACYQQKEKLPSSLGTSILSFFNEKTWMPMYFQFIFHRANCHITRGSNNREWAIARSPQHPPVWLYFNSDFSAVTIGTYTIEHLNDPGKNKLFYENLLKFVSLTEQLGLDFNFTYDLSKNSEYFITFLPQCFTDLDKSAMAKYRKQGGEIDELGTELDEQSPFSIFFSTRSVSFINQLLRIKETVKTFVKNKTEINSDRNPREVMELIMQFMDLIIKDLNRLSELAENKVDKDKISELKTLITLIDKALLGKRQAITKPNDYIPDMDKLHFSRDPQERRIYQFLKQVENLNSRIAKQKMDTMLLLISPETGQFIECRDPQLRQYVLQRVKELNQNQYYGVGRGFNWFELTSSQIKNLYMHIFNNVVRDLCAAIYEFNNIHHARHIFKTLCVQINLQLFPSNGPISLIRGDQTNFRIFDFAFQMLSSMLCDNELSEELKTRLADKEALIKQLVPKEGQDQLKEYMQFLSQFENLCMAIERKQIYNEELNQLNSRIAQIIRLSSAEPAKPTGENDQRVHDFMSVVADETSSKAKIFQALFSFVNRGTLINLNDYEEKNIIILYMLKGIDFKIPELAYDCSLSLSKIQIKTIFYIAFIQYVQSLLPDELLSRFPKIESNVLSNDACKKIAELFQKYCDTLRELYQNEPYSVVLKKLNADAIRTQTLIVDNDVVINNLVSVDEATAFIDRNLQAESIIERNRGPR